MTLPGWAQRAFEQRKPEGVGNSAPDPDRLEWWKSCKKRFESRWQDLGSDSWRGPKDHTYGTEDFVRPCILEAALDLAHDKKFGRPPEQVAQAVRELQDLNMKIVNAAQGLAALFRQRAEIVSSHGVEDYDCDTTALDPFNFWDALELSMAVPHVLDWARVAQDEIKKFLHIARTQSRPKPRWPDLLDQVIWRSEHVVVPSDAGDVAVMASRTKATEWSRWARRLLGTLDDWPGAFPYGFLRKCLTYEQLATLAEVALDAPAGAYNADQMRKLVGAYESQRNKQNGIPDDSP